MTQIEPPSYNGNAAPPMYDQPLPGMPVQNQYPNQPCPVQQRAYPVQTVPYPVQAMPIQSPPPPFQSRSPQGLPADQHVVLPVSFPIIILHVLS